MSIQIYNDIKEIVLDVIGAYNPSDVIQGTVVQVDPLKIEVDGDCDLYPSSCFIVPEHLCKHKIDIKFKGKFKKDEGLKFNGDIKINYPDLPSHAEFIGDCEDDELKFEGTLYLDNDLKEGDPVYLLKCMKGQKLLVLDREEKHDN